MKKIRRSIAVIIMIVVSICSSVGLIAGAETVMAAGYASTTFYSVNGELNLRSQPDHKSALVTTIYGGTPMYYTGQTGQGYGSDNLLHTWYYVRLSSGITGWVRSDLVYASGSGSIPYGTDTTMYFSAGGDINLRAQSSYYSALVTTVSDNTPLFYTGRQGQGYGSDGYMHTWYYVSLDSGLTGWVRSDLILPASVIGTSRSGRTGIQSGTVLYSISGEINVRSQPSHWSSLVTTVYGHTPMHYGGDQRTGTGSDGLTHIWYYIWTDQGYSGWVRSDLVW